MKITRSKLGITLSCLLAAPLSGGCGAPDAEGADLSRDGPFESASDGGDEPVELASIEQALRSCANPDGTNAVMAALAVAAGHELRRWRAGLDFEVAGSVIRLTTGTGSDGKPRGKSRCSGGKCPRSEALLSLQNDNATNVFVQAETSNSKVLVNPPALRSRMVAKLQEQITKDRDARDGDTNQNPKTPHTLTGIGAANLGGCGPHYRFSVAFDPTATTPKPLPAQLKWSLSFADQQNGWVDFRDLGNNVVAVDPTGGLNEEDTSSSGACAVACTKISTSDVSSACCSCAGVLKKFKRSTFNTMVYLCQ